MYIQTDCTYSSPSVSGIVSLRGVDFGQQESCLTAILLRDDIARHWEAVLQYLLSIVNGCLEKLSEVLVIRLVLIALITPRNNRLGEGRKEV